jgi:hypothetical protein
MLVVPALLSLKPAVVSTGNPSAVNLVTCIAKKLRTEPVEIVQKTAKKVEKLI